MLRDLNRKFLSRYRSSLGYRVLAINLTISAIVVTLLASIFYIRISDLIINEKISVSKVETQSALNLAQGHFNLASFQSNEQLRKVVQDFIDSARQDGSFSGREIVILPIENSGANPNKYQTIPNLLTIESIPEDYRVKVRNSNAVLESRETFVYEDGHKESGFIVGGKLNIPKSGVYEIYYLFKLDSQFNTLQNIAITLFIVCLLILVKTYFATKYSTKQVIDPLRQAAKAAERFTSGDYEARLKVISQDEFATLVKSFNEMATSIQQQISRLENLSKLQQRFVSDVSHELRTPLTTIRMASDVIYNHRKELDANSARSAELLLNQIDRFELLLNDLLEVSRFDAQAATLQLSNFDLISLIRKAIDYTNLNVAQKIEFIAPETLSINADARRIERIMRNLLSNAIDHSEDKPITITVAANERDVSVAVRDLGIGFNENQSLRLFDRFWRADPSRTRSRGGTGLGLSIALEDAKLHGGQLQAWGKPNQGANFVLTLPKVYGAQIGQPPLSVVPKDLVTK